MILVVCLTACGVAGAADLRLSDRLADLRIEGTEVVVAGERLTADAFVTRVRAMQGGREQRGPLYRLLDVTGPVGILWVLLGLMGQVLFTGRLVVQWLVSEKQRRSVVPTAFWWMSFGGAAMLLTYFVWRVDIVGVLGQSTGFFIYARNLWLIHKTPLPPAPA